MRALRFVCFTKLARSSDNKDSLEEQANIMPVTGELIRLMNYVDDIAATLRRIQAGITTMNDEEKKRLADYMRKADPNYTKMVDALEKS